MEKPKHEPGEPTLEDLAQQFELQLGRLHGAQALFLSKQHAEHLLGSQEESMLQRFETEQIETILNEIKDIMPLPWKAHSSTTGSDYTDTDASADTYIDPVGKTIVRYEATEAQGTEQIEIVMSYKVNQNNHVQQTISTETEDLTDSLKDLEHPAFQPIDLPNGDTINSSIDDGATTIELDQKRAKEFIAMLSELVTRLIRVYNQSGWEIMLDTDRTPNDVGSGDPRAVYKIERID